MANERRVINRVRVCVCVCVCVWRGREVNGETLFTSRKLVFNYKTVKIKAHEKTCQWKIEGSCSVADEDCM